MEDVESMEEFWTKNTNDCLDYVAPKKTRKPKKNQHCLTREVQSAIKVREDLKKRYQMNVQNGIKDLNLENQFKKHRNIAIN